MANQDLNRISEQFKGKSVFITGATGFLGKVLIEKLLRVTEVKTLYLLIRQKKNKCPNDRLNEMFNNVLFSVLKKDRPDSIKRCVVVAGDVMETDLGISNFDRIMLQKEVDYFFHLAASTRFDDTLRFAVKMNTLGTKYALDLAKECKKLKLFVHVSTAYAFPNQQILYEKTYDPPADPEEVLSRLAETKNNLEEDQKLNERYLQNCPNTYTFSKALAEGLVNQEMDKLPIIITRPAVVIPIYKEPVKGFFNNLQSPMGVFAGAGKGVIRSVYMDSKSYANLIPADCTINGILVASWDYLATKNQKVFNICLPHQDIKINWEEIIELGKEVINTRVPFNGIIWYPAGTMTKSKMWHYFNVLLFQLIPALFIDLLLVCLGFKAVLFPINQRLLKGQEMFEYYTTKAWLFDMDYFIGMRRKLTKKEKETFQVEAENVNIVDYLTDCILFARRHIFHETDEMMPAAKRNMKIFFLLDRIVKISFFSFVFYCTYQYMFARKMPA